MEVMKKLNKYILEFNTAWEYIQNNLDNANTLSSELLKLLNFKNGNFFTLLPSDANFVEINHFNSGGILQQLPEEKEFINGKWSTYTWIPNIRNEIAQMIRDEIESKNEIFCMFDNVSGTASDIYYTNYFDAQPLFYEKEVYFFLRSNNISLELVSKCLKASFSFWHSLGLFTTCDIPILSKTINLEQIQDVCLKTQLFFIGAYDGEGYVFWEKTPKKGSKGFFE